MPKRKPTVKAGATFFRSYLEAVEDLSEELQKEWCYAILMALFKGQKPSFLCTSGVPTDVLKGYWKLAEPNINKSISHSSSGSKGGKQKGSKKEAKPKQTASNDLLEDKDKDKDKDIKKKKLYKEKVLLTDAEYEKLCKPWGADKKCYTEAERERAIEFLDNAIRAKGYKYASHYAVLQGWVYDRIKGEPVAIPPDMPKEALEKLTVEEWNGLEKCEKDGIIAIIQANKERANAQR